MKAFVFEEPRVISKHEVSETRVASDEVLLKINFIGLCGTDLNIYRGSMPLVSYPRIPGHEVSATVMEKGSDVPGNIRIGDQVSVNPYQACGKCSACRQRRFNTCKYNDTLGVQQNGAMQEYFSIHHSKLLQSQVLSAEEFALIEPISVGTHAVNRGRITKNDCVLVIGCGMIGMGSILAAINKGAKVMAADLDPAKLSLAKDLGVTHTINASVQNVKDVVTELTDGEGADVCIEAVGAPSTYQAAIDCVGFAGRVVCIGYAKNTVPIDTSLIVKKELDILGSRNVLNEFYEVIKLLEAKRFDSSKLISDIYSVEDVAGAFERWETNPKGVVKLMVKFD